MRRIGRPTLAAMTVTAAVACSSGPTAPAPGRHGRPAHACSMLTSDEVEDIIGTPGPYTGAHEDKDPSGNPVWGCTWGTSLSYADIRELARANFRMAISARDDVVRKLDGIGDQAYLGRAKDGGGNPYVYFKAAGHYYHAEITIDRRAVSTDHADEAAKDEQELARLIADRLTS
ncbi:MAG TPA: hypothetical protein VHC49_21930 [Mycobacteriales bacterium]|nr:hypothetical protein [Mycobacteriales bacterium]